MDYQNILRYCEWKKNKIAFVQDKEFLGPVDVWGDSFYTSNYKCPECGRFMLKSNAGKRVGILTPDGTHLLLSVFCCRNCKKLYSSIPGKNLSNGECYVMDEKKYFDHTLSIIDYLAYSFAELGSTGLF